MTTNKTRFLVTGYLNDGTPVGDYDDKSTGGENGWIHAKDASKATKGVARRLERKYPRIKIFIDGARATPIPKQEKNPA